MYQAFENGYRNASTSPVHLRNQTCESFLHNIIQLLTAATLPPLSLCPNRQSRWRSTTPPSHPRTATAAARPSRIDAMADFAEASSTPRTRRSARPPSLAAAVAATASSTTVDANSIAEQGREPVGDVVEILGVRFERWRPDPSPQSQSKGASAGSPGNDLDKPLLLYLPGIEGLGTSVEPQLPALSAKFDVFRLMMGAEDRSTFSTLSRAVTDFVDSVGKGAKTVVVGESFGGMLGLRLGQLRCALAARARPFSGWELQGYKSVVSPWCGCHGVAGAHRGGCDLGPSSEAGPVGSWPFSCGGVPKKRLTFFFPRRSVNTLFVGRACTTSPCVCRAGSRSPLLLVILPR